jgi:hypothetical protein
VGFELGDRVITYAYRRGAYAELVAAPAVHTTPAPTRVGAVAAGALPISGITAHQAITEDLDVRAGERVLITAGAGGTGVFAIQLAAARGAEVIATASGRNRDFCESLGAAHVIDYTRESVESAIRSRYPDGVDALLECVDGENFDRSVRAVRRGGRAVGLVDEPPSGTPDGVRVGRIFGRLQHSSLCRERSSRTAGATSTAAALGNAPIVSSPRIAPWATASSALAASSSARTRSARSTSPRAAGVNRTRRPSRSSSGTPASFSSWASDCDTADGVFPTVRATSAIVPLRESSLSSFRRFTSSTVQRSLRSGEPIGTCPCARLTQYSAAP